MKNFETLEVGRTYRNGLGELVKIARVGDDEYFPFVSDTNECFTRNGRFRLFNTSNADLIELIDEKIILETKIAETEQKLAELKAQLQTIKD